MPNQLQAVLDQMIAVEPKCSKAGNAEEIMDLVKLQSVSLKKDVDKYCQESEA